VFKSSSSLVAWLIVSFFIASCRKEDEASKREAERLRKEVEALKADKDNDVRLRNETIAAQERTGPPSTPPRTSAPWGPAGQQVINEFMPLKEDQQMIWKMRPGRFRVRITTSNSGVKVRWVGASCAASKEVKVYDQTCEVTSEAQLVVENPGGLTSTGPTEQVSVNAMTM